MNVVLEHGEIIFYRNKEIKGVSVSTREIRNSQRKITLIVHFLMEA